MNRSRAYKTVELTRRFEKSYKKLSDQVQKQCDNALGLLIEEPLSPGLHLKPIRTGNRYLEARINDGDRLVIFPAGSTAYVMDVIVHDEIKKWGNEPAPAI